MRNEHEPDAFLDALRSIVGPPHVLTDPAVMRGYTTDWTGRWQGSALAVVRPSSTAEVAAVVSTCFDALVPITPQGGNTGLVGGGIPEQGSIVLSTKRLDHLEYVDPVSRTIAAGAGVTVARADEAASAHGLRFGIDLASRTAATLGGIVATNAGGTRMIRNGNTRSQLLGIEAVMANGFVLSRWTPLVKDNIGYDLPGLLTGSEGTLAVITRVLMKLSTPSTDTHVVVAGVADIEAAVRLHDRIVRQGLTIEAAELMTASGIDLVREQTDARRPFDTRTPFYALFEVSAYRRTEALLIEILSAADNLITDAAIAASPARELWLLRERHTECLGLASCTPPVKLDVSLPLASMSAFVRELEVTLAREHPAVRPILFGHFMDGNIHVNLLDVPPHKVDTLTEVVFTSVSAHRGSISAEHGIGRAKSRWVDLGRTPIDIHAMHRIKFALDPRRILNPGVLFPR
ncbi:FAD-binding oxidoreductase [Nocardia brasiliensis]|uniref:FAD-binding oxidoreductase n=1 Tax=Nocardia brasiliensis TaxID=37326 RepID=UPI0024568905|nr:FAD-binding oxidoreductase [Nocardia brasiliensis]